jgi:hypothetical protein
MASSSLVVDVMYGNGSQVDDIMPDKSSNRRAAEKLIYLSCEESAPVGNVGNYAHFGIFWRLLCNYNNNLRIIKQDTPEKYALLKKLFTTTQWLEAPDEVAKVISGESEVSKEIPTNLLNSLKMADGTVRKDFAYYLAYMAACLEKQH